MPTGESDWLNSLRKFATGVPTKLTRSQNEAQTRNYLIDPFLHLVGWNTHDPNQVAIEFKPDFAKTHERVDYALLHEEQPVVLIEAKSTDK